MHRATRGVCIGVDRHLIAGDAVPADLDAATVQFLVGIGAIERVKDEPSQPTPETQSTPAPAKAGKKEK